MKQRMIITPVVTESNKHYFVDPEVVPHQTMELWGEEVITAPYRPGVHYQLLKISQTESQLARGILDQTDYLDSSVELTSIVVKFDGRVIHFYPKPIGPSCYDHATEDSRRRLSLSFRGLFHLDLATTGDYFLWVNIGLESRINLETSELITFGGTIELNSIEGKRGTQKASDVFEHARSLVAGAEIIGYTLLAFRITGKPD